jgi:hypothetical protein
MIGQAIEPSFGQIDPGAEYPATGCLVGTVPDISKIAGSLQLFFGLAPEPFFPVITNP